MNQKIKEAVTASFVADALSLGVHWVYDIALIKDRYGRLEQMAKPELAPYHQSKSKGDFTHYGDQTMTLLESVAAVRGFDAQRFQQAWVNMNETYAGYADSATKDTLKNLAVDPAMDPPGSMSSDLGGAARIAPLALYYSDDPDGYKSAAQAQTRITHNQAAVLDTAAYFAAAACRVFQGEAPVSSLEKSMGDIPDNSSIRNLIDAGLKSSDEPTPAAIKRFGQMCSVEGALPSTIHLITRYENNLKEALIENIMAGGDSSARGLLAGFILGAHLGLDQVPPSWLDEMNAYSKITDLIG